MTSTTTAPDVVAATRPMAAFALGQHVADHGLPFEGLDIRDQVTVWVLSSTAHRWRTTHVTELDHTYGQSIPGTWVHTAHVTLHGSCVQVTLKWFTFADHHQCEDPGCGVGLCACRDLDQLCPGRVAHACTHGMNLCPDHAPEQCPECRDGRVS